MSSSRNTREQNVKLTQDVHSQNGIKMKQEDDKANISLSTSVHSQNGVKKEEDNKANKANIKKEEDDKANISLSTPVHYQNGVKKEEDNKANKANIKKAEDDKANISLSSTPESSGPFSTPEQPSSSSGSPSASISPAIEAQSIKRNLHPTPPRTNAKVVDTASQTDEVRAAARPAPAKTNTKMGNKACQTNKVTKRSSAAAAPNPMYPPGGGELETAEDVRRRVWFAGTLGLKYNSKGMLVSKDSHSEGSKKK
ncbi:hypothetical protein SBOR_6654 [Sclerotinia borealis F-4128]|uniref:Uncharacterized protein n=1 Tax=Sclerotinia borealis (strain F-4128) TaxID=1432307 RepID=W9CEG9_SCLBF|nr:hypothetical protein SBOR_6654 [Sclerotinia borealis F-4128]